ncbi:hypothetical protein ACFL20_04150 [Spirochaetota bacterium]
MILKRKEIIFSLITLLLLIQSTAAWTKENAKIKDRRSDVFSFMLGGGMGLHAVSDDINNYIKNKNGDSLNLNFSINGKMCLDISPLRWLNITAVGDAMMSFNCGGAFYPKYYLYKFSVGALPGIVFVTNDVDYMVSFGVLYNWLLFEKYVAHNIGYRAKFSFTPLMNFNLDFPKARGFIIFDYTYAEDNGFTVGGWGFHLGGEVAVF